PPYRARPSPDRGHTSMKPDGADTSGPPVHGLRTPARAPRRRSPDRAAPASPRPASDAGRRPSGEGATTRPHGRRATTARRPPREPSPDRPVVLRPDRDAPRSARRSPHDRPGPARPSPGPPRRTTRPCAEPRALPPGPVGVTPDRSASGLGVSRPAGSGRSG